jgi:hypothetical protein
MECGRGTVTCMCFLRTSYKSTGTRESILFYLNCRKPSFDGKTLTVIKSLYINLDANTNADDVRSDTEIRHYERKRLTVLGLETFPHV